MRTLELTLLSGFNLHLNYYYQSAVDIFYISGNMGNLSCTNHRAQHTPDMGLYDNLSQVPMSF